MDLNILGKRRIISDCQRVVKRSNAGAGIEVMFLWWLSFKASFLRRKTEIMRQTMTKLEG